MKKIQVLHIITEMDPSMGGVCQALRTIIPGLEELGVHNEVVSLDSPNSSFIKEDSFTIHAVGPAKGPWRYSSALVPWLLNNLPRFDSIILHGLWLYTGYATHKAIKSLQKTGSIKVPRLFVMPHGMLDPYFQKAKSRKLKAIRNWIYWKLIEQNVVNKANGLLFTCESELELAKIPFYPYKPRGEKVVGLGVEDPPAYTKDMSIALYSKCPELQEHSYILFLSRIHEKKGVDILINAFASIISDEMWITNDVRPPKLVIAGPGLETQYGKSMRRLADSLLPESIFFPGMLMREAKWGAFYGCDAFILPSHQENFGIAVAEALACSKPVIISNQVNIYIEIEKAGAGIVGQDTYEKTRESLIKWLNLTKKEKKEMSSQARLTFLEKFAVEPNIIKFKDAITSK